MKKIWYSFFSLGCIFLSQIAMASAYYWTNGSGAGSEWYWKTGSGAGSEWYWMTGSGAGSEWYWKTGSGAGSEWYWKTGSGPTDINPLLGGCLTGTIVYEICETLPK